MEVRRARDGDLGVVELGPRSNDGQRLERLRRAPEVRDEVGSPAVFDDLPAGDGNGMNAVPGLGHASSSRLDDDRFHGG
jgi:hypothetical protein